MLTQANCSLYDIIHRYRFLITFKERKREIYGEGVVVVGVCMMIQWMEGSEQERF